jgi:peptide/nickel transport system substrate-binding protein
MRRRKFLYYAGGGVSAASLAALGVACGDDDDDAPESTATGTSSGGTATSTGTQPTGTSAPATGNLADSQVLRTRFYFDLLPLNPGTIFGIEQENTATAVYNGLTAYDGKTELIADLAESWEQVDGTTWVFKLNKGVQWQQGYGELTAEDVAASYTRIMESPGSYRAEFGLVDSFTATDPLTVQVKLKSPDANFGHQVSNYHQGSVANMKAFEKLGDALWVSPIGTGPFELKDLRPGQGFYLDRFADYFKGPAVLERIDMRTIPDANTAAIALKNNEIDMFMAIRSEPALDTLEGDDNIAFGVGDKWGVSLWMFNTTIPALADVRVRQAMAFGVDLPAAIKATAPRNSSPADNILPDWLPEYTSNIPKYDFDLAKAKQLLDAAGVDNVSVKYMNLGNPNEFLVLHQASLASIGINLEFDVVDRAQFNSRRVSGDFEITGRGFPSANANQILFGYLHPDNFPPVGFNSSRYNKKEVTDKLIAARSELDEQKRLDLYHEIQATVMEDLPYLPTSHSNEWWAYRANVKNVEVNRMPQGIWYPMQIEKA